jgi:hypothetical protein
MSAKLKSPGALAGAAGGSEEPTRAAGLAWTIAQSGSHRERDDDYSRVVARLDSRTRVIVCADRTQWIVQRRDAGTAHRAYWRGISFHLSRDGLIAASVRLAGACAPAALAILAALPQHFAKGGGNV